MKNKNRLRKWIMLNYPNSKGFFKVMANTVFNQMNKQSKNILQSGGC